MRNNYQYEDYIRDDRPPLPKDFEKLSNIFCDAVFEGRGHLIPYKIVKPLFYQYKVANNWDTHHMNPKNFGKIYSHPRVHFGGMFGTAFSQIAKDNKAVNEKLKNENIFFPPYFDEMPVGQLRTFANVQKTSIEIFNDVFSDKKHQKTLIDQWARNDYFSPRMKILKKALDAHTNKDYELSVPVFLIQIEAILSEILNSNHKSLKNDIEKNFQVKKDPYIDGEFIATGKDHIIDVICKQIFKPHDKNKGPKNVIFNYPNRHTILHGQELNYSEDSNYSTRCIIVLDFLRSEEFLTYVKRVEDGHDGSAL